MLITKLKRQLKVKAERLSRGIRYGVWSMKGPKKLQEKMILRIVKMMMEKPDSVVFYSPETGRIYVHTQDKKYIVVYDKYTVNISNHNYFYAYGITESLSRDILRFAIKRLESERIKLEEEMFFNEKNFLNEVHSDLAKGTTKIINQPEEA